MDNGEACGRWCNDDIDFLVTFDVKSLTKLNERDYGDDEKLFSIVWDGHIMRWTTKAAIEDLTGAKDTIIHCTPLHLSQKLKYHPIVLNIMCHCDDLGQVQLSLTEYFCNAVLCEDFNSQTIELNVKFAAEDEEGALVENILMDLDLKIEKLGDKANEAAFQALKKTFEKASKRMQQKKNKTDASSSDDEEALCSKFTCAEDTSEYCKKNLQLDEHVYRIVNGHLINVKEKRGMCGNVCEVASKYCEELKEHKMANGRESISLIDLQKLFDFAAKADKCIKDATEGELCKEIFTKDASENVEKKQQSKEKKKKIKAKKGCVK
jgi:hypothetical protein